MPRVSSGNRPVRGRTPGGGRTRPRRTYSIVRGQREMKHSGRATALYFHSQPPERKCQLGTDRPALRQVAEPCQLALSKVAAAHLDTRDGGLQRLGAVEVRGQLLVAQRLASLAAQGPFEPPQSPHLFDPAAGDHLPRTPV